jgi:hypothetical protein
MAKKQVRRKKAVRVQLKQTAGGVDYQADPARRQTWKAAGVAYVVGFGNNGGNNSGG